MNDKTESEAILLEKRSSSLPNDLFSVYVTHPDALCRQRH